jgi:hypothetical protein
MDQLGLIIRLSVQFNHLVARHGEVDLVGLSARLTNLGILFTTNDLCG